MRRKRDLLLICNRFPFGHGETFIANEFPYLVEHFNQIVILSRSNNDEQTRDVPKGVTIIRIVPKSNWKDKMSAIFKFLNGPGRYLKMIYSELKKTPLPHSNSLDKKNVLKLLHFALKSIELQVYIEKNILPSLGEDAVLYSYWQDATALSISLIKKKKPNYHVICRAHRGDLYFMAPNDFYLPFRYYISKNIDQLFFISNQGRQYQSDLLGLPALPPNFKVSRLGTQRKKQPDAKKLIHRKLIVSCSNLIPVKRVRMIIEALSFLEELQLKWIHFGGGVLEDEIKMLADEKLGTKGNIEFEFKDRVPNNLIHEFYSENQIDLFINVSESEGIPVSIMEATSYGIPIIATDVGGTSEALRDDFSYLLPQYFEISTLRDVIRDFFSMTETDRSAMSMNAKSYWTNNFNSDDNFRDFITQIYQDENQ